MLQRKKGVSKTDAITEIAELYSVQPSIKFDREPIRLKKTKPLKKTIPPVSPIIRYLSGERGINKETIKAFKIESTQNNEIVFPYLDQSGEVMQRSYLSLKRDTDGKKITMQDSSPNQMFFGWHLVERDARKLIITEGQIDCMTLHTVGIKNSVSMPAGVNNLGWIDTHWDYLMEIDEIILAFDQDKQGQECVERVAKRLGVERCKTVKFEENDINDLWNGGYEEFEIVDIFEKAVYLPNDTVQALGSSKEKTKKFLEQLQNNEGTSFFLDGIELNQRLGELTIWSGYSGSGKTTILNQNILHTMANSNHKVCYASFEQTKEELELLCVQQMFGRFTNERIDRSLDWLSDKMFWYNYGNPVSVNHMFDAFLYAMRRYGCDVFVVDNLVTSGVSEDDKDAVMNFVNKLKSFCKENNVSIHLVAHSRKSQQDDNESKVPGKHTVRGHSSITDVCMNGLTVWRNPNPVEAREPEMPYDGLITVWKHRINGNLTTRGYYFNGAFKRATSDEGKTVHPISPSDKQGKIKPNRPLVQSDFIEDEDEFSPF